MNSVFDAFWRAAAYCVHPRVIAMSLLPLVLMAVLALGLSYFFWESAVSTVNAWLLSNDWLSRGIGWLDSMGLGSLKSAIAPLIVMLAATPLILVSVLLVVAFMMTPAMVNLVVQRRFVGLERAAGSGMLKSVMWSLGVTAAALIALLVSMPLWLIPPLMLLVPPLIWGWLTYLVMSFDVLAQHASSAERKQIMRENRAKLLFMGIVSGYMGAAPALLWASGVLFVVLAPLFILAAIWIYTLVFAFSSLWFSHFCLAALEQLRAQKIKENMPPNQFESARSAIESVAPALPHQPS